MNLTSAQLAWCSYGFTCIGRLDVSNWLDCESFICELAVNGDEESRCPYAVRLDPGVHWLEDNCECIQEPALERKTNNIIKWPSSASTVLYLCILYFIFIHFIIDLFICIMLQFSLIHLTTLTSSWFTSFDSLLTQSIKHLPIVRWHYSRWTSTHGGESVLWDSSC